MQATTSGSARREAARAIAVNKLDPRFRNAVSDVLNDCSLYRRMPTKMIDCDPQLFTFLAQNPDVLVKIWRQLGITRVELQPEIGNSYRLSDNAGTTGQLTIVEQSCDDQAQNQIVMYVDGAYEGRPLNRPLKAQCVLLVRSGSIRETNNRNYVAVRLDSFVHIDHVSVELFAKAIHPLVGKTADRNFVDTLQFISNFSHAAEMRPVTIERLVTSLTGVSDQRQGQLIQIAYQCGSSVRK